jgi:hypothetical protein
MRRTLAPLAATLLVAGLSSPAYADQTVVQRSLSYADTDAYFSSQFACAAPGGSPAGAFYRIEGDSPLPVLGQRSWGYLPQSGQTGGSFGVGASVTDSGDLATFQYQVYGAAAGDGRAYVFSVPPGTGQSNVWIGRAVLNGGGDVWTTVSAATATYTWAEYDSSTWAPTGPTSPAATIAGFDTAKGISEQGYTAIMGFGCAGQGYYFDDFRFGAAGNVTTVDYEALSNSITMHASAATITAGGTSKLTGLVEAHYAGGTPGTLQAKAYGATSWSTVASVNAPEETWTFTRSVAPKKQTSYRWVVAATESTLGATSPITTVKVRTALTANVADSTLHLGQSLVVTGRTTPAKPGSAVTLYRSTSSGPVVLAKGTVRSDGTYRLTRTMKSKGKWTVYVTVAAGSGNLSGKSASRTLTIS